MMNIGIISRESSVPRAQPNLRSKVEVTRTLTLSSCPLLRKAALHIWGVGLRTRLRLRVRETCRILTQQAESTSAQTLARKGLTPTSMLGPSRSSARSTRAHLAKCSVTAEKDGTKTLSIELTVWRSNTCKRRLKTNLINSTRTLVSLRPSLYRQHQ